jgi:hypothetical protein
MPVGLDRHLVKGLFAGGYQTLQSPDLCIEAKLIFNNVQLLVDGEVKCDRLLVGWGDRYLGSIISMNLSIDGILSMSEGDISKS